jgi:hypothetical protein
VQLFLVAAPGEAAPALDAARQALSAPGRGELAVGALSFTVSAEQP